MSILDNPSALGMVLWLTSALHVASVKLNTLHLQFKNLIIGDTEDIDLSL